MSALEMPGLEIAALRADLERVTRECFAAQDQLELTRTERDGWRNTHAAISALSLRYHDENVALRARLAEAERERDEAQNFLAVAERERHKSGILASGLAARLADAEKLLERVRESKPNDSWTRRAALAHDAGAFLAHQNGGSQPVPPAPSGETRT